MTGVLRGPSWALVALHSMWSCALGLDMYKFWKMRKTMRIFARSPGLALLSGFAGITVQTLIVAQEIMAQEGKRLPCAVILYSNPLTMGLYGFPYILRGLKAVIISHKVWRTKYLALLSRNNVSAFLGVAFVVLNLACVALQQAIPQVYGYLDTYASGGIGLITFTGLTLEQIETCANNNHFTLTGKTPCLNASSCFKLDSRGSPTEMCFALGDWWLWGTMGFILICLTVRLFLELARLNDKINMATEIRRASGGWLACAAPYFLVLSFGTWDIVEPPRQLGFILWLAIALSQVNTFMIESRRRRGEVSWCWKKPTAAVFVDEAHVGAWKERWHNSKVIMGNATLDQGFQQHAQDYLCSESYDFLREVESYVAHAEESPADDDIVFSYFRDIVAMYILAGSNLEINIETAMRNKILEIGDRTKFLAASSDTQRDVFNPARMEITKMVDENLVSSFWKTRSFLDSCRQLEIQQDADLSLTTTEESLLPNAADQKVVSLVQALTKMQGGTQPVGSSRYKSNIILPVTSM